MKNIFEGLMGLLVYTTEQLVYIFLKGGPAWHRQKGKKKLDR